MIRMMLWGIALILSGAVLWTSYWMFVHNFLKRLLAHKGRKKMAAEMFQKGQLVLFDGMPAEVLKVDMLDRAIFPYFVRWKDALGNESTQWVEAHRVMARRKVPKFKVGDCVLGGLRRGEVIKVDDSMLPYQVKYEDGSMTWHSSNCVSAVLPRIGDRVRCRTPLGLSWPADCEGTIIPGKSSEGNWLVSLDKPYYGPYCTTTSLWFAPSELTVLIKVEPKPIYFKNGDSVEVRNQLCTVVDASSGGYQIKNNRTGSMEWAMAADVKAFEPEFAVGAIVYSTSESRGLRQQGMIGCVVGLPTKHVQLDKDDLVVRYPVRWNELPDGWFTVFQDGLPRYHSSQIALLPHVPKFHKESVVSYLGGPPAVVQNVRFDGRNFRYVIALNGIKMGVDEASLLNLKPVNTESIAPKPKFELDELCVMTERIEELNARNATQEAMITRAKAKLVDRDETIKHMEERNSILARALADAEAKLDNLRRAL